MSVVRWLEFFCQLGLILCPGCPADVFTAERSAPRTNEPLRAVWVSNPTVVTIDSLVPDVQPTCWYVCDLSVVCTAVR